MPRVRFLQVSDLHFGFLDRQGLPVAPTPFRLFPGWLGHDPLAVRAIARLVRQLRRDDTPLYIVTTGDLTARGHPDQFEMAAGFLGATTQDGPSRVGLRQSDWQKRGVSGNHDHWQGDRADGIIWGTIWAFPHMWGPPTDAFHRLFDHLPFADSLVRTDGLPLIRFIGIDTDGDIASWTFDRLRARGAFESDLKALDGVLPPKEPSEVRVLLAHHCREYRGFFVEIVPESRAALDDFIVQHEIDVLLSGHTHDARVAPVQIPDGGRTVLYARCGTSSQVNPRDSRFRRSTGWAPLEGLPRDVTRSVILHELDIDGEHLVWEATAYALNRRNQFVPAPSRGHSPRPENLHGSLRLDLMK